MTVDIVWIITFKLLYIYTTFLGEADILTSFQSLFVPKRLTLCFTLCLAPGLYVPSQTSSKSFTETMNVLLFVKCLHPSKCKCPNLHCNNVCLFLSLLLGAHAHSNMLALFSSLKQIVHLRARRKWVVLLNLAKEAVKLNCSRCIVFFFVFFFYPFLSCHACLYLSQSLSLSHQTLSYMLMCEHGLGGGGKLWATLLIFHMLHQCRSSDSVGLVFSQTRAVELSNTLSTFHWGAVHWLCQDKKHCDQPLNFQREHGVSETSTSGTRNYLMCYRPHVG